MCGTLKKTAQITLRPKKDLQMFEFWSNNGNISQDYVSDYRRVECKYKGPHPLYAETQKSKLFTNRICQTPVSLFDWPSSLVRNTATGKSFLFGFSPWKI